MKDVITGVTCFLSLIIVNLVWPIKGKYASITDSIFCGFITLLISCILHIKLRVYQNSIFFYSNEASSSSWKGLFSISYIGFIIGLYFGFNYSAFQYFISMNLNVQISISYILAIITAFLCFIVLTVFENSNKLRAKYPLAYDPSWNFFEFLYSPFIHITISEYIGIAAGFYSSMLTFLYYIIRYLLEKLNLYIAIGIVVISAVFGIVGFVLFRIYKKKMKS